MSTASVRRLLAEDLPRQRVDLVFALAEARGELRAALPVIEEAAALLERLGPDEAPGLSLALSNFESYAAVSQGPPG